VQRYKSGGGTRLFNKTDFDPASGRFAPDGRDGSVLVRLTNPMRYERRLPDGGIETYTHTDARAAWPRRFFLTERRDPAGNPLKIHYDERYRITTVTDATGGQTMLEYQHRDPLKITAIVDPAGRRARIDYDARGRLIAITDALGLVSKVAYSGRGVFIERLQTPYGETRFASGIDTDRWIEITDPLGRTERIEARDVVPGIADAETNAPQIPGIDNQELSRRNTFYWNAEAHAQHKGDYTKAKILHWREEDGQAVGILSSLKEPLETRRWYAYDPQKTSAGSCAYPASVARTLPNGQTQQVRHAWNSLGNRLMSIDPVGRETRYDYAKNGIDLLRARQKTAEGADTLIEMTWNAQHRPLTVKNAAGRLTQLTWNAAGQLTAMTDAQSGHNREYRYDPQGRLAQIIDPQGKIQAQYTWDAAGNLASETDSEGRTLKHHYDALNRRTKTHHPDGTATEYTWNKLDLARIKDRHGKTIDIQYDAARQPVAVRDALRTIQFGYDRAGRLTKLIDGEGNSTIWQRDLQGRIIGKYTADSVKLFYDYDSAGRQIKRTDARRQKRLLAYSKDNQIAGIAYTDANTRANPRKRGQADMATVFVLFKWDAHHPRLAAMKDGTGRTDYRYAPAGQPGALRLMGVDGPNGSYRLKRDAAGRVTGWHIDAAGEDYAFDALGRLVANRNNALGEFQYGYLGQTDQLTQAQLSGAPIAHRYAYAPDGRLKGIGHPSDARSYGYTTAAGQITGIVETLAGQRRQWDYEYDEIDRLTGAKRDDGQHYTYGLDDADNLIHIITPEGNWSYYHNAGNKIDQGGYHHDANGSRIEDDRHTYRWDAENRLLGIGYKNDPAKKTEFRYDGGGRRVAMIETDGIYRRETRYTWCGNRICAARDEKGQAVAYYFNEGVYRPAGKKREYYARDHLGSVRDVLDEKGQSIARYDYDPYGKLLNGPQTPPEFGYAGMQYHAPSGLYLTKYRVYDPKTGKWLTRDPIGEAGGLNLYGYVGGNPVRWIDPLGLARVCRRPLSGAPFMAGNGNMNLGLFHEHIFYSDNITNIGYGNTGIMIDENIENYTCGSIEYVDEYMRQAVVRARASGAYETGENYGLLSDNCQRFVTRVLQEYWGIVNSQFTPDPSIPGGGYLPVW
jgi:RHS repeat-associated protein